MGAENVEVDFSEKTEIRGKNRCGKSTLMNAYFDVMTGKFANGTAPTNICPVDENGEEKPVKEIERAITLEINGTEHEIRKVTKRKYRKGVFIGNETVYMLDGVSAKSAEVNDFLSGIAPAETIAICSNASVFLSTIRKSTADARKAAELLSGFDIEQFCKDKEEYRDAYELAKGKNVEDVLKQLRKKCTAESKELDRLNVELDYEQRRLDRSDDSDLQKLESEKSTIIGNIDSMKNLKEALNVSIDRYTYLVGLVDDLKKKMSAIEDEQKKDKNEKIETLKKTIVAIDADIDNFSEKVKKYNESAEKVFGEISSLKSKCTELKNCHSIMDAVQYGNDYVCPKCGRGFNSEEVEVVKEKLYKEKEDALCELKDKVDILESAIKAETDTYLDFNKKSNEWAEKVFDKREIRKSLEINLEKLLSIGFEKTEEYKTLEKRLKEAEEESSKLFESTDLWRQVTERISNYKVDLSQKESEIKAIIRDTENTEKRIDSLKESVKKQAQKTADVERRIDMLQDFSIAKNTALEDMVNRKFEFIKIKMSEETLSGDIKETLRINVNGVDYFNGLNHGDRILAEIFLLKGLQDMNSIRLPIWIDDTESLDENRIPDVSRQLIVIRRTDDETLKVCNGEE
nr:MAG TPA: chromosome partition protein [Caudoviricetes sp.]